MNDIDPTALRLDLLKAHLERSDASVRAYDEHAYKIKGFAITASSAATLFAIDRHEWIMYLVAVLAAVGFFLMDANAKRIQRVFIQRTEEIEKFFREPTLDQAIGTRSFAHFHLPTLPETMGSAVTAKKYSTMLREMRNFNTWFLYASVIFLVTAIGILDALT